MRLMESPQPEPYDAQSNCTCVQSGDHMQTPQHKCNVLSSYIYSIVGHALYTLILTWRPRHKLVKIHTSAWHISGNSALDLNSTPHLDQHR